MRVFNLLLWVDGTIRKVSCKQTRLREAIETVWKDLSLYMCLSATSDESEQVSDEQAVELAFDV